MATIFAALPPDAAEVLRAGFPGRQLFAGCAVAGERLFVPIPVIRTFDPPSGLRPAAVYRSPEGRIRVIEPPSRADFGDIMRFDTSGNDIPRPWDSADGAFPPPGV